MRLAITAGLVFLAWGGWRLWIFRTERRSLAEARAEIQAGRHGHAVRLLKPLAMGASGSARDEAAYLLGVCEQVRGHDDAAAEAWARVSHSSPLSARAIQGRMDLKVRQGRLRDAESLIVGAMADPRIDPSALMVFLSMVYSLEGRVEDGRRLIESNWRRLDAAGDGASERAIRLVRLHAELGQETSSAESVRAYLDQALVQQPDDDRVWLGRAHLAIRSGALEEAARWLDRCLRRQPDDAAVWRARLDWGMAAGDEAVVNAALEHLPGTAATELLHSRVRAWLARHRGEAEAESEALERVIAADPTDQAAIDRLAELSKRLGRPARADELKRLDESVRSLDARYRELLRRNQPLRDAEELARIAERLGRRFEAEAFLTLAVAVDPGRADLRGERARVAGINRQREQPRNEEPPHKTPRLAPRADAGRTGPF